MIYLRPNFDFGSHSQGLESVNRDDEGSISGLTLIRLEVDRKTENLISLECFTTWKNPPRNLLGRRVGG